MLTLDYSELTPAEKNALAPTPEGRIDALTQCVLDEVAE